MNQEQDRVIVSALNVAAAWHRGQSRSRAINEATRAEHLKRAEKIAEASVAFQNRLSA